MKSLINVKPKLLKFEGYTLSFLSKKVLTYHMALKKLSAIGLTCIASLSFIIGFPWETKHEISRTLRYFQNRFEKYDLVIADELGYISFDREGADLLFSHLSLRTATKSTIITSNLTFERWGEIFGDPTIASAMIDRLTYKATLVDMQGESYRLRDTLRSNGATLDSLKEIQ